MDSKGFVKNKITADILSFEKGAEHYENLKAIKLNSDRYKLLIMSDYLPMIGELNGDMILVPESGEEVVYRRISGYYRHSHNEFEFILKEKLDDRQVASGDR